MGEVRRWYVTCGAVFAAGGAFASWVLRGPALVIWLWMALSVVCVVVALLSGDGL